MGGIDKEVTGHYDNGMVNTGTLNNKEKKVMRCAVYIRVSTNKDVQKDSLISQKEMAYNYIRDKGWSLHEVYTDIESGTTAKRAELQRLLSDAKEDKFDVIIGKELSRLARNGALSYQIRDLTEREGIHLITLDGLINTMESQMAMYGFLTTIYEEESRSTSRRIKSVLKVSAEKGEYLAAHAPLGYEVINKNLFIKNDETPDIVRRIYREYIEGRGHDAIAKGLYEEDVPTPAMYAGKKNAGLVWHGSTIRKILTNPHYTGNMTQNRSTSMGLFSGKRKDLPENEWIVVDNTHEAIISVIDFNIVQGLIEERKSIRPKPNKRLFSNLLSCADCGRSMHYKKSSEGYVCGNYNKHGPKKCSHHRFREADLIEVFKTEFRKMSHGLKLSSLTDKLEKQLHHEDKKRIKKLPTLKKEYAKIKMFKRSAFEMFAEEKISREEYDEYIQTYNEKEKSLELEIASLTAVPQQHADVQILDQLNDALLATLNFDKLSPELLHRFVEKIEIKADGSPRIHYRFSDTSAFYLLNSSNAQHST